MGRPIKKKFFGNLNPQGVGGEGVSSVTVTNTGTNGVYSTTATVAFSAPDVPGGIPATGTAVVNTTTFRLTSITLNTTGSGYTTAPTITVTPATTGTAATFTVALSTVIANSLAVVAFVPNGTSAVIGDIIKQESSTRYLVKTVQGIGQCKLSAATPVAGKMNLIATDIQGSTYYVTKLTAHRANLTQKTAAGTGFVFATGSASGWTAGAATASTVSVASN